MNDPISGLKDHLTLCPSWVHEGGMTLAAYLKVTDQTQEEFAAKIAAKPRTVGKWARGDRMPRPRIMMLIKKATEGRVTPGDFYIPRQRPAPIEARGAETG